jgi:hypothetical protein
VELPNKNQRGLWTNNVFKHEKIVLETFGGFNLNSHGVYRGIKSLKSLYKKNGKNGNLYLGVSHHAPLLTAGKDLFSEEEMWRRIANCDINQYWSGTIIENKGKLRAYFCEVAASFDLANDRDIGLEVIEGWWRLPMKSFKNQVSEICPSCGVPARLKGSFDYEETDTYTISNQHLVDISRLKKRKAKLVDKSYLTENLDHNVTEYTESHLRRKTLFGRIEYHLKKLIL